MNADLALAIIQEEVEELQGKKDIWSSAYQDAVKNNLRAARYCKKELDAIENKLHPLLVVLESAKVLHQLLELKPADIIDANQHPQAKQMYFDVDDLTIRSDLAEKIGLKDKNENGHD